jgi:hypothetical protein
MPHTITPDQIRAGQVVRVTRNGVPLRFRVDRAGQACVVLHRIGATLPVNDARTFLALCGPAQPVNDSGRWLHQGLGLPEAGGLACIATRHGDELRVGGAAVAVELVADPRNN